MRPVGYLLAMALAGYLGGSIAGYALSEEEIKKAMCSYYSEWDFCREVRERGRLRDLAIEGLSRKVHELERRIEERKREREKLCVTAHMLNVRLYPLDGKVIEVYRKGKEVEVLDRIGGWVRTQDGWVSEKYLGRCRR